MRAATLAAVLVMLSAMPVEAIDLRPHWIPLIEAASCQPQDQIIAGIEHGEFAVEFPFAGVEAAIVCELGANPRIMVIPFFGLEFACPTMIEGEFITGGLESSKQIVDLANYRALDGSESANHGTTTLRTVLVSVSAERETHLFCYHGHWMAQDRDGSEAHPARIGEGATDD
jgi:hypothetical protein